MPKPADIPIVLENNTILTYSDHSRSFNDWVYVYPVVSRRSNGVSVGINLNVNNACNWRCVYCQVEGLHRGNPSFINLSQLEHELESMIEWIQFGDFLTTHVSQNLQRFADICLSGNGESTMSEQFLDVLLIIAKLRKKYALTDSVKTVLISNGSNMDKASVVQGLDILAQNNGEVWFKIDRASSLAITQVNQVNISINSVIKRLKICSAHCKTYIQSCWFKKDGENPTHQEFLDFIDLMIQVKEDITGVLLYSTARKPMLIEGASISSVDEEFLSNLAKKLIEQKILVKYYK